MRVVGTNTLRKARDSRSFLRAARERLGHGIDIISGFEEARLIYLGVSHDLEDHHDRRLVVDIGGGSTELIVGQQFEPRRMESLYIGCVSLSNAHFRDGRIKGSRFRAAELAALQELEPLMDNYRRGTWDTAIGASGTILAIDSVVREQGWSNAGISAQSLKKLKAALIEAGDVASLDLPGLDRERAPVFPGGVAILLAVFKALDIEHMQVSQGALREGLLHDLLGRVRKRDVRESSIKNLAERYHVDTAHAERISQTALMLFDSVAEAWQLEDQHRNMLRWAAAAHEIGRDIAHSAIPQTRRLSAQQHEPRGVLTGRSTSPGVSRSGSHRRKYPLDESLEAFSVATTAPRWYA